MLSRRFARSDPSLELGCLSTFPPLDAVFPIDFVLPLVTLLFGDSRRPGVVIRLILQVRDPGVRSRDLGLALGISRRA